VTRRVEGSDLLGCLEKELGKCRTAKWDSDLPFSVLQFDDQPEPDLTTTLTFGISTHVLSGRDGFERRQELMVLLRRGLDEEALQIAANVGAYVIDAHVALAEGETVRMPRRRDGNLDRLVVAPPDPFPEEVGRCDEFDPPVELVWLLPFAGSEHHIVAEHGWRDLLHWMRERELDPYDLSRPVVL
jgi:hypothetical protein